jgi:hypothetical protein
MYSQVSIAYAHINDCSGSTAGTWLFAERRWLDAKDEDDYHILTEVHIGGYLVLGRFWYMTCSNQPRIPHSRQGFHRLRERFPSLLRCSEDDFLHAVTAMKVPLLRASSSLKQKK